MEWSEKARALLRGIEKPVARGAEKVSTLWRGIKLTARVARKTMDSPAVAVPVEPRAHSGLIAFNAFGDNPGGLRMLAHVPQIGAGRPLVVLLHGCGQDAATFAADSGWIALADKLRFPLILPEQLNENNAGRCFNWFRPKDTARDAGEARSIASMTRTAIRQFDSDTARVFVVGLSAGAAMAAALLAAYPDLFAAGASVAGLPVGSARSGMQALLRMASAGPDQSDTVWASQVRTLGPAGFAGPWPRLSVWQGNADTTVAPGNGEHLAAQWRAIQGLAMLKSEENVQDGVRHRIWPDAAHGLVESWTLPGFPHAYPVGSRDAPPGRFVARAPVDATAAIARFFGLD